MLCGDIVSWNSLITGYACRGGFSMVKDLIIDLVMENVIPDAVSKIRLVSAAAETGAPDQGRRAHGKALQLFYEMQEDASPDNVTFVSVLSACSHSGLEIKGLKFSGGCLRKKISLINACQDVETAEIASREPLNLDPEEGGGCTLLSNIYAASGRWSYSKKIRETTMENRGVKKTDGHSVVVDGVIHNFLSPQTSAIQDGWTSPILNCLKNEMKLGDDFTQLSESRSTIIKINYSGWRNGTPEEGKGIQAPDSAWKDGGER
ncbi:hypothetical protein NC653_030728 [Populus alba x Populus x berolinensis]|uniref:Pentatricopeptide repeat-containing protein n=1 Tax=Populus alba x Populus x berolinensis TaxID=444605 RepID=A0AAD6Q2G7_9ROSI|nr:hypothetical protein NC653_030728 [Populus alba x Populus x berolinensis]